MEKIVIEKLVEQISCFFPHRCNSLREFMDSINKAGADYVTAELILYCKELISYDMLYGNVGNFAYRTEFVSRTPVGIFIVYDEKYDYSFRSKNGVDVSPDQEIARARALKTVDNRLGIIRKFNGVATNILDCDHKPIKSEEYQRMMEFAEQFRIGPYPLSSNFK